jgi:hypothetical protein
MIAVWHIFARPDCVWHSYFLARVPAEPVVALRACTSIKGLQLPFIKEQLLLG